MEASSCSPQRLRVWIRVEVGTKLWVRVERRVGIRAIAGAKDDLIFLGQRTRWRVRLTSALQRFRQPRATASAETCRWNTRKYEQRCSAGHRLCNRSRIAETIRQTSAPPTAARTHRSCPTATRLPSSMPRTPAPGSVNESSTAGRSSPAQEGCGRRSAARHPSEGVRWFRVRVG